MNDLGDVYKAKVKDLLPVLGQVASLATSERAEFVGAANMMSSAAIDYIKSPSLAGKAACFDFYAALLDSSNDLPGPPDEIVVSVLIDVMGAISASQDGDRARESECVARALSSFSALLP
jgi:hypothetical protein